MTRAKKTKKGSSTAASSCLEPFQFCPGILLILPVFLAGGRESEWWLYPEEEQAGQRQFKADIGYGCAGT
jgi:hypothetical protein